MSGYTYGDLIHDMRQAAMLLAQIDHVCGHTNYSVRSLEYEADYLSRQAGLDDEVEEA